MFGEDYEHLNNDDDNLVKDTDFFKEPIDPGEVPELREDVKIIATIESDIKSVQYLLDDIKKSGGMSQSLALEAANFSEDIKATPLGFYTVEPTSTRLKISVESLLESIKNGLKKIIEFIRECIRKAIAWVAGLFKKKITDKDFEKVKQKLDIQEESDLKAWQGIVSHMGKINDVLREYDEPAFIERLIETTDLTREQIVNLDFSDLVRKSAVVNKLFTEPDPFMYDIIFMGPYITLIKELIIGFKFLESELRLKFDNLEHLLEEESELHKTDVDRQLQTAKLKELEKELVVALNTHRGAFRTNDLITLINNERNKTQSNRDVSRLHLRDVIVRLQVNVGELDYMRLYRTLLGSMRSMVRYDELIFKINKKIDSITFGELYDKGNNEFISAVRSLTTKLSIEVNNITIISRYLKSELDLIFFMNRDLLHYIDNCIEWILLESKKRSINVPEEFKDRAIEVVKRRVENYNLYNKYTRGL